MLESLETKKADAAAKSALSLSITPMKLPATDMLPVPRVMRLISEEWQEIWDCCAGDKLHAMLSVLGN